MPTNLLIGVRYEKTEVDLGFQHRHPAGDRVEANNDFRRRSTTVRAVH